MSLRFAVIGNPIEHSLSPIIHQQFAKQVGISLVYEKILANETTFKQVVIDFFSQGGRGLNITMPFKTQAFTLAEVRTSRCLQAKAANTLWMANGQLHADNTDGVGLIRDLAKYISLQDKQLLICGAGGATRGLILPLLDAGIYELCITNRTLERANALKKDFPGVNYCSSNELAGNYDVIINTTPATDFDLPTTILNPNTYCYDLVYNLKTTTPFTKWARQHDCQTNDGLGMLMEQAAEAFYIWHGIRPDTRCLSFLF